MWKLIKTIFFAFFASISSQARSCDFSAITSFADLEILCTVYEQLKLTKQIDFEFSGRFGAEGSTSIFHSEIPYKVTLPTRERLKELTVEDITLPLIHEFVHLRQIQDLGSIRSVERTFGSRLAAELHADFTVGCFIGSRLVPYSLGLVNSNPFFSASFTEDDPDFHGKPHSRTGVIRLALFGNSDSCFDFSLKGYRDFQSEVISGSILDLD